MDISKCNECEFCHKDQNNPNNYKCDYSFQYWADSAIRTFVNTLKGKRCRDIIVCNKVIEETIRMETQYVIGKSGANVVDNVQRLISIQAKVKSMPDLSPVGFARNHPRLKLSQDILKSHNISSKINSLLVQCGYRKYHCLYYEELWSRLNKLVREGENINEYTVKYITSEIRDNLIPSDLVFIEPYSIFGQACKEHMRIFNNKSFNFKDADYFSYHYKVDLQTIEQHFKKAIYILKFLKFLKENDCCSIRINPSLNSNKGKCWILYYEDLNECSINVSQHLRLDIKYSSDRNIDFIYNHFYKLFCSSYRKFFLESKEDDFLEVHYNIYKI